MPNVQTSSQSTTKDLDAALASPTSPTTPHSAADAKRGMSTCSAWKPSLDRRQSWNSQEYKHKMQMTGLGETKPGAGFSEQT